MLPVRVLRQQLAPLLCYSGELLTYSTAITCSVLRTMLFRRVWKRDGARPGRLRPPIPGVEQSTIQMRLLCRTISISMQTEACVTATEPMPLSLAMYFGRHSAVVNDL